MMVHDLRSPLTSVMGFLDLLRTASDASAEKRVSFIDKAYAGSAQMAEMISSLLDINRLEAGEMPGWQLAGQRAQVHARVRGHHDYRGASRRTAARRGGGYGPRHSRGFHRPGIR
jgi:signal transduction histidine kinase